MTSLPIGYPEIGFPIIRLVIGQFGTVAKAISRPRGRFEKNFKCKLVFVKEMERKNGKLEAEAEPRKRKLALVH